jgi:hypothetical protein
VVEVENFGLDDWSVPEDYFVDGSLKKFSTSGVQIPV